ncbi:MAG: serine hydrolase [Candidatus Binatia bacterium]
MSQAVAGRVVLDVVDRQVLEATDADTVIGPGRVADLLLVVAVRDRLAAGDLTLTDRVTLLPVAGDRGPHLSAHDLEVGELLQLLLMTDSQTAAKTLAWAVGPSIGRALARMQQVSKQLGLTHTVIAEDWPFGAGSTTTAGTSGRRGATTARDLGRVALVIVSDPELRRRLALDGVPISNGGLIVRATSPLIALHDVAPVTTPPTGTVIPSDVRISLAEHDNLTLLAVTTGPRADDDLTAALERGFHRYRRVELVREGQAVGPMVHVRGGIIPSFNAVAAEPWALTTTQGSPNGLAFHLQLPSQIEAPVEVHQPVGELVVERDGRVVAVVPLVAPQAIAPSGWLDTARQSSAR